MQHPWLAALARSVGTTPSRRTALTTLLGGLPGLLLTAGIVETVAKKKGKKQRQQQRRRRKKRPCRALDRPGQECRCLTRGARCTADANCCPGTLRLSCQQGLCQPCDVCAAGCAFTSVQAAIDAAAPGETIHLCAGTFKESLDIDNKNLALLGVGDGAGGTTLEGRGGRTLFVDKATVTLERARITGGRADLGLDGGGIFSQDSELTLTGCAVSGNTALEITGDGGGIAILGGHVALNDSTVQDNEATGRGGGIAVFGNGALTLSGSRVEDNTAGEEGGGIFRFGGTVTLQNSVVTGNTPDNCVGVDGCG